MTCRSIWFCKFLDYPKEYIGCIANLVPCKIGSLRSGPTWENVDGSAVVGSADVVDAAFDYFDPAKRLIKAKSNAGLGVFGNVSYVLRGIVFGGSCTPPGTESFPGT